MRSRERAGTSAEQGYEQRGAALQTPSTSSSAIGRFSEPFVEPTINGVATSAKCITDGNGVRICKPTAGSVNTLPSGDVVYWDALEGTENIQFFPNDLGYHARNDQVRLLDFDTNPFTWSTSTPSDAGANPDGYDDSALFPGGNDEAWNDGALFCADFNFLPDGRILAVGGTAYYLDPEIGETNLGVLSELEGLRNSRIYDPVSNRWTQVAPMQTGRWYPTLVTLGDGRELVAPREGAAEQQRRARLRACGCPPRRAARGRARSTRRPALGPARAPPRGCPSG